jgi:hypothetical protein
LPDERPIDVITCVVDCVSVEGPVTVKVGKLDDITLEVDVKDEIDVEFEGNTPDPGVDDVLRVLEDVSSETLVEIVTTDEPVPDEKCHVTVEMLKNVLVTVVSEEDDETVETVRLGLDELTGKMLELEAVTGVELGNSSVQVVLMDALLETVVTPLAGVEDSLETPDVVDDAGEIVLDKEAEV